MKISRKKKKQNKSQDITDTLTTHTMMTTYTKQKIIFIMYNF